MPAFLSTDGPPDPYTLANLPAFGPQGLKGKGRQNGQFGKPAQNQPGLDDVEISVKGLCDVMLGERRERYRKEIAVLEERIDKRFLLSNAPFTNAAVQDSDGNSVVTDAAISDSDMNNARLTLSNVVSNKKPALKRLQNAAQNAIIELNEFGQEHHLRHPPEIPESLLHSWGLLGIAIAVETVLNGFFFGSNMTGGIASGVLIAALISAVNVICFGFLVAATYRQIAHRANLRKFAGFLGLIFVAFSALCFNFAVAHYRDALPPDYPPEQIESAEATKAERQIAECWRGDSDIEASQEAWCLFTTRQYRLDGFMSYLLFLLGLAACAVGAWEWSRMTDRYPGYGKLGRIQRKTQDELESEHEEVQEKLKSTWETLRKKQDEVPEDPVERWDQADHAIKERSILYEDFRSYVTKLEESCRGAIEIYRTANREERKEQQPVPGHWAEHWEANWELPDEPHPIRICSRERAIAEKKQENKIRSKHLKIIDNYFEKCKQDLEDMTNLYHV